MKYALTLIVVGLFSHLAHAGAGVIVHETDLRDRPSFSSNKVVWLPIGLEVTPLKRQGGWTQVQVDGHKHKGWVRRYTMRTNVPEGTYEKVDLKTGSGAIKDGFKSIGASLTGLFSGVKKKDHNEGNLTTTVGIRGLSAQDIASAKPDPQAFEEFLSFEATSASAQKFAANENLSPLEMKFLPKPPPPQEAEAMEMDK